MNTWILHQQRTRIGGFLTGYSGAPLEPYRLNLRGWIGWLDTADPDPFAVEPAHIELYTRWCESEGNARSTIGRRLSTICGFYRYRSQERLIAPGLGHRAGGSSRCHRGPGR